MCLGTILAYSYYCIQKLIFPLSRNPNLIMRPSKYVDDDLKLPSEDDYDDDDEGCIEVDLDEYEKKEKDLPLLTEVKMNPAVKEEDKQCSSYIPSHLRPVFQLIPNIKGHGLVLNDNAKIAFSTDCYIEHGTFCGLRRGRKLDITEEGNRVMKKLITYVGLQDSKKMRIEIRDSVFHYNIHLWDGYKHKPIPFAHQKEETERKHEDIHMRASLIALMFYFDTNEYDRRRIVEIYSNWRDTDVRTYIYHIARGISSRPVAVEEPSSVA